LRIERYPERLIRLLYLLGDKRQMRLCSELCTIIRVVLQAKEQNKIVTESNYSDDIPGAAEIRSLAAAITD